MQETDCRISNPDLFLRCLVECATNKELLHEFDRLTGYNISMRGDAIILEIDRTTGYLEQGARAFYEFVVDCIYLPVEAVLGVEDAIADSGHDNG